VIPGLLIPGPMLLGLLGLLMLGLLMLGPGSAREWSLISGSRAG
jgi:hypothetical protein